jgi:CheY-like chemotaxis protein
MDTQGGVEATGMIREYERCLGLPRTPIIGLLIYMMHQDTNKFFQVQMDDFLSKPVTMRNLTEKVLHFGRLGRSAAGSDIHQFLASISGGAGALRCIPKEFGAKL